MSAPLLISGLWRGIAAEFARRQGHDPALLLACRFSSVQPRGVQLDAARMRNRASYIAVQGFGIPQILLCRETGLKRSALSKAIGAVEEWREDPQEDADIAAVADLFGVSL